MPYACGCNQTSDCPAANPSTNTAGEACDTTMKKCTSACTASQLCNGGCCGSNGQCAGGGVDGACGIGGATCLDCTTSCNPGPTCNVSTGACGCTADSTCLNDNACHPVTGTQNWACNLDTNACCVPGFQNMYMGTTATCCTGLATSGFCDCYPNASSDQGNGAGNCCSGYSSGGLCACVPSGGNCYNKNVCCTGNCTVNIDPLLATCP